MYLFVDLSKYKSTDSPSCYFRSSIIREDKRKVSPTFLIIDLKKKRRWSNRRGWVDLPDMTYRGAYFFIAENSDSVLLSPMGEMIEIVSYLKGVNPLTMIKVIVFNLEDLSYREGDNPPEKIPHLDLKWIAPKPKYKTRQRNAG